MLSCYQHKWLLIQGSNMNKKGHDRVSWLGFLKHDYLLSVFKASSNRTQGSFVFQGCQNPDLRRCRWKKITLYSLHLAELPCTEGPPEIYAHETSWMLHANEVGRNGMDTHFEHISFADMHTHCPLGLHTQHTNSKIKLLGIWKSKQ